MAAHLEVSHLVAQVQFQLGLCLVFLPSLPRWNCGLQSQSQSQSHWVRIVLIRGFRQGPELGEFVVYPLFNGIRGQWIVWDG